MAGHSETRVFTKSTSDGKVTIYLGRLDFVDHLKSIDPVEGVVTVDANSLSPGIKVFAQLLVAFRYGREDMDVIGVQCRKDLYRAILQVFPKTDEKAASPFQELLMRQLGGTCAFPFQFELQPNMADTVRLTTPAGVQDKQCGVDYELKVFIAQGKEDKPIAGNVLRVPIRKLTYAPEEMAPAPRDVVVKQFVFSSGKIRLEATLDREKYYHGECIAVNTTIDNNSNKIIKKIRYSVVQYTSLQLHDDTTTCVELTSTETTEGFPIDQNQTGVCGVFHITPSVTHCRSKTGVALDGKASHQDTNLASSTVLGKRCKKAQMGIMVSYNIKIKLVLGFGARDFSLELPFTLTYPEAPEAQEEPSWNAEAGLTFEDFGRPLVEGYEDAGADD